MNLLGSFSIGLCPSREDDKNTDLFRAARSLPYHLDEKTGRDVDMVLVRADVAHGQRYFPFGITMT